MKKQIALLSLVAAALMVVPTVSRAEVKSKDVPAAASQAAPARRHLPFHGKVSAMDAAASTITVGTMTFNVTADTKLAKEGKDAKLADFAVGDYIAGAYTKNGDKLTALSIKSGKGEKKKK
ncbi:MAG: DUF5666 domain-containing protein [Verrucomicrobiota bacterium]